MEETVCITGCSSGIGRETARLFLGEDWRVYATARDPADLADLAEAGCETAALDVTDDDQVEAVMERIADETGRIDCLVNNAGYGQFGPLEDVPIEQVHAQFDANVYGPHRLTRAVLPHMREAREGRIINVSSVAGRVSVPGGSVYCGSKAALEAMSDALRAEVSSLGIDVVIVEPGPVETGFADRVDDEVDGLPRTAAYNGLYTLLDDTRAIGGGGPGAVAPARVAETIVDAAIAINPDPRYTVGPIARAGALARFLPARLRDTLYQLVLTFV